MCEFWVLDMTMLSLKYWLIWYCIWDQLVLIFVINLGLACFW